MGKIKKYINREISWLGFNERVLQEAEDPNVPLIERIRFLGIYSNNQDEFFRVRVATLRRVAKLDQRIKDFGNNPGEVLEKIQKKVRKLQVRFDNAYKNLLEELRGERIHIVNEQELTPSQGAFVRNYFEGKIRRRLFPIMIDSINEFPRLNDKSIYLAVRLLNSEQREKNRYSLIEIPGSLPRFIEMPEKDGIRYLILVDDIIRYNLSRLFYIFDHDRAEAYTIKFTRDAELDLDNDVSMSFIMALEKSLKRRKLGDPVRLTYDEAMPRLFLEYLIRKMKISQEEDAIIPGARYHNFKDFMKFPSLGRKDLLYEDLKPMLHPWLPPNVSLFKLITERDIMLYFPFHTYDYIVDFLREAAINPKVTEIHMTLYRAAANSSIIQALINAARNGVHVTAVVELQARFDEEANIYWANRMKDEGIEVIHGVSKLKVHSKLCLVRRVEDGKIIDYAIIGTGNFNENTAKVYTDVSLITCNEEITKEVKKVFNFFESNYTVSKHKHLMLAPFYLRNRISRMINTEIKNAKAGKEAWLFFKMNSLVDKKMIKKLYEASQAGVKIRLIVRGICSLIPKLPEISENIEVISIVDRFLEHSRIYASHGDGDRQVYIGSADLMTRNLDYRVEVLVPIIEQRIQQQLMDVMELQWWDHVKSRRVSGERANTFRRRLDKQLGPSQLATYRYFKTFLESEVIEESKKVNRKTKAG